MGTTYDSWCSYIDAQFPQPRLQPADSNWTEQCVVRIIIKTEDSECDGGTRTEKWSVERPSNPAHEPPCTDLSMQEPYVWKSYTLAANWVSRQHKASSRVRGDLYTTYTYRIYKFPLE